MSLRSPNRVNKHKKRRSIARFTLRQQGFTINHLIEQYPNELKRLKLACDMGDTGIELRPPREGEHFLGPAAHYILREACLLWRTTDCIAGIPLPDISSGNVRFCATATYALESLPSDQHTPECIMAALRINGSSLQCVKEEDQTREMILVAVRNNGRALEHVRKPIDFEIALAAVYQSGMALSYIPASLRTREMCLLAVSKYGMAIAHVPHELLNDQTLCLLAVTNNGDAFTHVSRSMRTEELFIMAAKSSPWMIEKFADLLTEDASFALVRHNPFLMGNMPLNMRSYELCLLAAGIDGEALCAIPEDHRSDELIEIAIRSNPKCIDYLDAHEKTEARLRLAYQLDPASGDLLIAYPLLKQLQEEYKANTSPEP